MGIFAADGGNNRGGTRHENAVRRLLARKRRFRVRLHYLREPALQKIEAVIDQAARRYERSDLSYTMFTCVYEFLVNGVKANIKRVLFERSGLNMDDPEEYAAGMQDFRSMLSPENIAQHLTGLKQAGYFVELRLDHSAERLLFEIFNNAVLTAHEEKRIREKFATLMSMEKPEEFFLAHIDYSESAGLGLALVISILRNLQINPGTLRIFRTDSGTCVRLVFPLSATYVDPREAYDWNAESRSPILTF
jgi:hypothetical protein